MYTRTSVAIERQIAALHRGVDDATRDRDAIPPEVAALTATLAERDTALARAEAGLAHATDAAATAGAGLQAALATRTAAQTRVAWADADLDQHRRTGPDLSDHDERREWAERLHELIADLAQARKHLTAAEAAVGPAQAARDAAYAAVPTAVQVRDAAWTARDLAAGRLAAAQGQLATAQAALAAALDTLTARLPPLTARLAGLRDRRDAVVAEPMDRAAVDRAAEQALADLLDRRHHRYNLLSRRAAAATARAAALTAQDGTVDALATLRADIGGWSGTPNSPSLLAVVAAIDAVVAASQAQRVRPPSERTDDLAATHLGLLTRVAALEALHARAVGDRAAALEAVRTASNALVTHQLEA